MSAVDIVLTVDDDADLEAIGQSVEERLRPVDVVDDLSAMASPTRDAATVIAGLTVAITLLHGTAGAVAGVRRLIGEIKGLVNDIRGISGAYVEVDGVPVPIDELDDASIEILAGEPS